MLYHRLLSGLIQSSSDLELKAHHLDFDVFWLRIGVDPYEPFSDGFCEQTGLSSYDVVSRTPENRGSTADNEDAKRTQFCLHTLVDAWKRTLRLLGIASVDPTLTLNYRQRETSRRKRRRRANDGKRRAMNSQEEELNRAIIASLAQADQEDPALAHAIAESLRYAQAAGTPISEQAPPQPKDSPSKRDAESDPDETDTKLDNCLEEETGRGSELIGSASFVMDDAALDARLEKVLEWWHGIRQPEGVELEDTGRCKYVLPSPSLYNSLLMRSPIVPASLVLAANGVRRRAMNSYRNYGRELEMQPNVEETIMICVRVGERACICSACMNPYCNLTRTVYYYRCGQLLGARYQCPRFSSTTSRRDRF